MFLKILPLPRDFAVRQALAWTGSQRGGALSLWRSRDPYAAFRVSRPISCMTNRR
jgi:hypothetical protein